jgi:tripartite-type tricarboxylate transporter receptor subunit TctC
MLRRSLIASLAAPVLLPGSAFAEEYPKRTVRILVGFLAGGPIDSAARIIADGLGQKWGVPVIVENRPGANSRIAIDQLRASAADGYTLLLGTNGAMTVNPPLQGMSLDQALRGIKPIAFVIDYPYLVVAAPSTPFKDLAGLVRYAKENPGTVTYASPGIGAVNHLAVEDFAFRAGISLVHVPYNGDAGSLQDLMAGRVMFGFNSAAQALVRQGKLRALAATSRKRIAEFPDVPTLIESGYPDFVVTPWGALFAPIDVPLPIVQKINADVAMVLEQPEYQRRVAELGYRTESLMPEALLKFIGGDFERWQSIIKRASLTAEPTK